MMMMMMTMVKNLLSHGSLKKVSALFLAESTASSIRDPT